MTSDRSIEDDAVIIASSRSGNENPAQTREREREVVYDIEQPLLEELKQYNTGGRLVVIHSTKNIKIQGHRR